jgi:hypothetical protein
MEEQPALRAAILRFPDDFRKIEELGAQPGSFRDMCEDLAEAERGLQMTDRLPLGLRDARRAEWNACIENLTQEIERALREFNVVPIGRSNKRR